MKYKNYTALDFANDAFFIRWVRHGDDEANFFWQTFLRENPSCGPAVQEARDLVLSFQFRQAHLSDGELMEMRSKLWMHFLAEKQRESLPKKDRRWLLAAACIVLPLLVLAGYILINKSRQGPHAISATTNEAQMISLQGKNSLILMADGSRIWLKDSSTLAFQEDFTKSMTREVHLEGEAFFEVAHDTEHPFIVHTSGVKIKVLGTSFSVKSYAADKIVETTLVSGRVHIEQSDDNGKRVGVIELKPNQRAVFNKESKVFNVRELKVPENVSWKRTRLVFDAQPLNNVLQQLELWFDVDIHVDTDRLECKLTATIERESLDDVLRLLQLSHGIDYRIEGRNVFITGALCK